MAGSLIPRLSVSGLVLLLLSATHLTEALVVSGSAPSQFVLQASQSSPLEGEWLSLCGDVCKVAPPLASWDLEPEQMLLLAETSDIFHEPSSPESSSWMTLSQSLGLELVTTARVHLDSPLPDGIRSVGLYPDEILGVSRAALSLQRSSEWNDGICAAICQGKPVIMPRASSKRQPFDGDMCSGVQGGPRIYTYPLGDFEAMGRAIVAASRQTLC
ncbi:hypothetical protein IAR55_005679 [Kwoniella newhampshirensis]|uniref:Uncharacterized protein n=1 Tax=Kwoniella newhampshirensis TaxID=1651941 RepID=A0AAW0YVB2_9TREE